LHITTKIEGHPQDDLLRKMGRGGFPALLFLDADGQKMSGPRSRSVASFENCRKALTSIDATKTRADSGDKAAAIELLLYEVELRRVKQADFAKRAAAMESEASDDHRAALSRATLDFRVEDLARRSYRNKSKTVGAEVLQMLRDGAVPGPGSPTQGTFWYLANPLVKTCGDAELIRTAAKRVRADYTEDDRQHAQARKFDGLANGLDKRDALAKRAKAGEAGLEAKMLLIELRIQAVTFQDCKKRLDAALAVATEEEGVELRQRTVDLEALELITRFWAGGDRAGVGARLVKLFGDGKPAPSNDLIGLAHGPLAIHFGNQTNRKQFDEFIGKLQNQVEAAPYLQKVIDNLNRSVRGE
jgi:hypothetical protein